MKSLDMRLLIIIDYIMLLSELIIISPLHKYAIFFIIAKIYI